MLFPWNTKTTDRKGINKQNMYMQIKHSEKDNIEKGHYFFLIGIHSMQGWTATTRHGVTRKKAQKRLQATENLFRKSLQSKDVC